MTGNAELKQARDEFWHNLINRRNYHPNDIIIFPGYSGDDLDMAINRVLDLDAMGGCIVKREVQGPDMVYVLSVSVWGDLCQIRRSSQKGTATLNIKRLPVVTPPKDFISGGAKARRESFVFWVRRFFMFLKMDDLWLQPDIFTGRAPTGSTAPEKAGDNGHYAYPLEKRREIVEHYRQERTAGNVHNKNAWAQSKYRISGKTLKKYEEEFG